MGPRAGPGGSTCRPALTQSQGRLDDIDLAHVQLAAEHLPGVHQDVQPGDVQGLERRPADPLMDTGVVERQLADERTHADAARVELRARQVLARRTA